jgi:hypothetical protein
MLATHQLKILQPGWRWTAAAPSTSPTPATTGCSNYRRGKQPTSQVISRSRTPSTKRKRVGGAVRVGGAQSPSFLRRPAPWRDVNGRHRARGRCRCDGHAWLLVVCPESPASFGMYLARDQVGASKTASDAAMSLVRDTGIGTVNSLGVFPVRHHACEPHSLRFVCSRCCALWASLLMAGGAPWPRGGRNLSPVTGNSGELR